MGAGEAGESRDETVAQRDDRNTAELIQELRVVGLGVQVLFGFLLSLPFTIRFTRLTAGQRDLYLACVVLAAVATVLLIAPVAYHRLVFRQGMKERLVRFANVVAILGLAAVGGAVLTAVLLVTWYVGGALAGAAHHGADRPHALLSVVRRPAGEPPATPLSPGGRHWRGR